VNIAFPYHLDAGGATASAPTDAHILELLEQLLFTQPGERVNRPDFGCGLLGLLFGPNTPAVAAAASVTITGAIQRWLGDLITLTALDVTAEDSALLVTIGYATLATGAVATATFAVPTAA
jgi:phage baseplate assembly protein W